MSATLEKPKPGLVTALLLPLVIWVVFSVVAVVFAVMGFSRADEVYDDFARIPAGSATEVDLSATGGYRIWLERPGAADDFSISATATVTDPDGQEVPVETYVGSLDYDDATAVLTFDVDEPGTYTIEATESTFSSSTTTTSSESTRFAIGKDNPLGEVGKGFALMAVIGGVGFLIALVLMIVMLVKRGRSKKRIFRSSYGDGGYGPPPGGFPPPGGYPQGGGFPQPGGYAPPGSTW